MAVATSCGREFHSLILCHVVFWSADDGHTRGEAFFAGGAQALDIVAPTKPRELPLKLLPPR